MSFKKKIIKAILNRADIVDIVANFLPIKQVSLKNTDEYVVSCPFHNERTPSFTITRQKQFYHCFGCGAHGNAIAFIVEFKGVTYAEAIIKVAELSKFKLPIGKTTPSKKKISDRKKRQKMLEKLEERKIRIKNKNDVEIGGFSTSSFDEEIPF